MYSNIGLSFRETLPLMEENILLTIPPLVVLQSLKSVTRLAGGTSIFKFYFSLSFRAEGEETNGNQSWIKSQYRKAQHFQNTADCDGHSVTRTFLKGAVFNMVLSTWSKKPPVDYNLITAASAEGLIISAAFGREHSSKQPALFQTWIKEAAFDSPAVGEQLIEKEPPKCSKVKESWAERH